jgi:hypothetical protein
MRSLFLSPRGDKIKHMWRPRGLAALLIAVLAVVIGGGGWRKWSDGGAGVFVTRLKFPTSESTLQSSPPAHCSLLDTTRRHDLVIAAERVVLQDGVYPAASESH